jgi:arylsulfatase
MPHDRSRAQLGLALCVTACLVAGIGFASPAAAQDAGKPNILIIWGDDIGWDNISAYMISRLPVGLR